jgi:hypothetical protein
MTASSPVKRFPVSLILVGFLVAGEIFDVASTDTCTFERLPGRLKPWPQSVDADEIGNHFIGEAEATAQGSRKAKDLSLQAILLCEQFCCQDPRCKHYVLFASTSRCHLRSSELDATEKLSTNDRAYSGSKNTAVLSRDQAVAAAEEWSGPSVEVESGKLYEIKKEGSRKTEDDVPFRPRSQERIATLMQWLKEGGADVDAVEIMPEGGLRTLIPLFPGQFVVKIPPEVSGP